MKISNINFTTPVKTHESDNLLRNKVQYSNDKKKKQQEHKKKKKFASDDEGKNIDIIL